MTPANTGSTESALKDTSAQKSPRRKRRLVKQEAAGQEAVPRQASPGGMAVRRPRGMF